MVAFWCKRIVQWWRGQQFRMRLWPVFEVHQENLLTSDLLGWRPVSWICVLLSPSIGVLRISFENCQNFSQILSGWANNVFKSLYGISPHERMEVVDSALFSQLVMNFEAGLEKIFKQLELFRFPVKRGKRCREWLWQFLKLLILLWKFPALLLFASCWRANRIWSASIVAGVFSLRNYGWLVEQFFFCFPEDVQGEQ